MVDSASAPQDLPAATVLADAIQFALQSSGASSAERAEVLAQTLVNEALRPYWTANRTAEDVRTALRAHDPELARVLEALAPYVIGRRQVRAEADAATAEVERLITAQARERLATD